VHVTANTFNGTLAIKLLSIDNSTVLSSTSTLATNVDLSAATLPATGTYFVVLDPSDVDVGSASVSVTASSSSPAVLVNSIGPPTVVVVSVSASVTVGVSNGPANATDWVGMYPLGAADNAYLTWQYLNGSQTPPGTGSSAATLTFTTSSSPGRYEFRFFSNNGFSHLATSTNVVTTSTASLLVNGTALGTTVTVAPSASVTVAVSNGPANTTDWVGLYAVGSADSPSITWQYLSGTTTPPATGLSSATLTFTMPSTPGNYEFRFFANNEWTHLAFSTMVTVTPP
jgi:hypothetical protein